MLVTRYTTSVFLIIYAEGTSEKPRQITDRGKFKLPFDDLWEEATTPRFKFDGSLWRQSLRITNTEFNQLHTWTLVVSLHLKLVVKH